jgi:hypothetical protein
MNKKAITIVIAGIMLFTFCTAPSAQAFVPVFAFVVVGAIAVAGGAAVINKGSQEEQQEASAQEQTEDLEIKHATLEVQEAGG